MVNDTQNVKDRKGIKILAETIAKACKQYAKSASFDKTLRATVMDRIVNNDHLYKVKMLGIEHTIPSAVIIDKFPCQVWVTVPCNNFSDMFISGKRFR